ncbi:MAG: hypothetical protein WAL32_16020 [Terriglobales bacterium]
MYRYLTIAVVVLATVVSGWAAKETVQELAARAEAARPEDRPGLYIEIAERQLKAADELFGASKDQDAVAAVRDVVTYSEKAHDAAIASHHRLKGTEISLRKMAAKLRDIKRSVTFDVQGPVQAASDRLETLRSDLLAKMFGAGK